MNPYRVKPHTQIHLLQNIVERERERERKKGREGYRYLALTAMNESGQKIIKHALDSITLLRFPTTKKKKKKKKKREI
jgi:hypothetical protein